MSLFYGDVIGPQKELKGQYYLQYVEKKVRAKLHQLSQQVTVREYVKKFNELMFQIFDLDEEEAFFFFIDGLKPRVKKELKHLSKSWL
ncbi:hypothetical protein PVK06_010289 [Gossypium arboreum]|uniref:Retrotransposon gag domain-containing protein n=1 Tax=Gossypium arboreum TaxID=29729 RepID=A0ABR0Q5N0_GOSAR|nr:hypothetical protein PVK06_010289 [Gossypium arboreum]